MHRSSKLFYFWYLVGLTLFKELSVLTLITGLLIIIDYCFWAAIKFQILSGYYFKKLLRFFKKSQKNTKNFKYLENWGNQISFR